jgi:hypothetical protein
LKPEFDSQKRLFKKEYLKAKMKQILLLLVFCLVGCVGKKGNYIVIHKPTGTTYYLNGAPLNHKDGPVMGLPGKYSTDYYFFHYGQHNEATLKLLRSECRVIAPDGSIEDAGQYLPRIDSKVQEVRQVPEVQEQKEWHRGFLSHW